MKEGELVWTDGWDAALENGCALGGANDRGGGVPATAGELGGDAPRVRGRGGRG